MLKVEMLSKHFGGVKACDRLDFSVDEGEIFGLIGPNGSGKSTAVNLICGVYKATSGDVFFENNPITNIPSHKRLALGIARTFQNIRLFNSMPVWKNIWVAQNSLQDIRHQGPIKRWFGGANNEREEIDSLLDFSGLSGKEEMLAGNLAFGEQRRLELARAVATKPKLVLLDEPAAGMNKEEIYDLEDRIKSLRDNGITILLVEHVMELVMGVTDKIVVLNFGQKIAQGTPSDIQKNKSVQEAYLGVSENKD